MKWTDELTTQFLNLYEGEPVLWNPRHEHRKSQKHVIDAWERIQTKLSTYCCLTELKRKKDCLLSTYRKLAIKVINSVETAVTTKDVYKPEWLFYEKIRSFLHSVYTPRGLKAIESNFLEEEEDERLNMSESSGHSVILENEEAAAVNVTLRPRDKKRKIEHVEKCMDEAYSFLKQAASKPKVIKDESYLFCELLCCKLRKLDDHSREMAMHEIDNLVHDFQRNSSAPLQYYYQQPSYFQHDHALSQDNVPSAPNGHALNQDNGASAPSLSSETQHSLNKVKSEKNIS